MTFYFNFQTKSWTYIPFLYAFFAMVNLPKQITGILHRDLYSKQPSWPFHHLTGGSIGALLLFSVPHFSNFLLNWTLQKTGLTPMQCDPTPIFITQLCPLTKQLALSRCQSHPRCIWGTILPLCLLDHVRSNIELYTAPGDIKTVTTFAVITYIVSCELLVSQQKWWLVHNDNL